MNHSYKLFMDSKKGLNDGWYILVDNTTLVSVPQLSVDIIRNVVPWYVCEIGCNLVCVDTTHESYNRWVHDIFMQGLVSLPESKEITSAGEKMEILNRLDANMNKWIEEKLRK